MKYERRFKMYQTIADLEADFDAMECWEIEAMSAIGGGTIIMVWRLPIA